MKKLICIFILATLSQSLFSCCCKNSNPVELWLDSLKNRVDLQSERSYSYRVNNSTIIEGSFLIFHVPFKKIQGNSGNNHFINNSEGKILRFYLYDQAIPTSLEAAAFAYLNQERRKNNCMNDKKFSMDFGSYGDFECEKVITLDTRFRFVCERKP